MKLKLLVHVLQSLRGHLPVVQSFISLLKNSSEVAFLIALGTNFQVYGEKGNMSTINVPKDCIFFLELSCFSGYKSSQQNEIYLP